MTVDSVNCATDTFVSVAVTSAHLEKAGRNAEIYQDRPGWTRTPAQKLVDALMEAAENAIREKIHGLKEGKKYQDVAAATPVIIFDTIELLGVLEIKTKNQSTPSNKIQSSQAYHFMIVLDRLFDKNELVNIVDNLGPDALIDIELKFQIVEIFKFNNGSRDPIWKITKK